MELYVRSILVILMMIGSVSSGVLVVGPKFVLPNQEYTLTISNDDGLSPSVKLNLTLEAIVDGNTTSRSTVVDVRKHILRNVKLAIPNVTPATSLNLTIDGLHDFRYHEVVTLAVRANLLSGLIQTDKPVYNPGDTVKFRVIVLDTELKPPAKLESVRVVIRDPKRSEIRRWLSAKLFSGVFENRFQVASYSLLGLWTVVAIVDQQEIVSKTFEVREYALTSFDLQVVPSVIPLLQHDGLNLTIAAYYHFGKPVAGTAVVEFYLPDDILHGKQTFDMSGTGQTSAEFQNALDIPDDHANVRVQVSFTEKHTNRTVSKDVSVPVYKHPYRVTLVPEAPVFHAGRPFKCTLQFTKHDGTLASGIAGDVQIEELQYNEKHTSDSSGSIKLNLLMNNASERIHITFTDSAGDYMFEETVYGTDADDTFINLELRSQPNIKSTRPMSLVVTCSEGMSSFVYYVLSKGKIIDARLILLNSQTKYRINQIRASEKMLPQATIIVISVANNKTLKWASLNVSFPQFGNSLDIRVDEKELRPSDPVTLTLRGRPGSYVGLTAYDKSLLQFSQHHHDIVWKDIEELFGRLYNVDSSEHDPFNSMGMFVRSSTATKTHHGDRYRRSLVNSHPAPIKLTVYRTSFPESWLWKNVSMGNAEKLALHEYVPDSTTTWYVTGFAISPEHGLGIVKKPIQLVTSKPFYVVESLPYSLKRGEAVVLQFTLFSNLGSEYVANVTLFNVHEQMEFLNRAPSDIAYTKSLIVRPGVGTPVSFLVKARKLGEMVIRVRASIMNGAETDALERFVRVLPENLNGIAIIRQFFHVEYDREYSMKHSLDVPKERDPDSLRTVLTLYPNIRMPVIGKLNDMLDTPRGSAVLNLIDVIPSLVVLESLVANRPHTSQDHSTIDKAKTILRNSVQTLATYRQPDGSFGDWPKSTQGSVFVTALTAQILSWSSKYIDVDKKMAREAFLWLAAKQTSSGRYDEVSEITYQVLQDGSRQGIALTSYVMIVFLESGIFVNNDNYDSVKQAIDAGIDYIAKSQSNITDVYDLALATYALMLNNHTDKQSLFNILVKKGTYVPNVQQRYWSRSSAAVETTAYALLCYYENKQYVNGIEIMRWMEQQRDSSGRFSSPQATFVGLHAMAKLMAEIRSNNTYEVVVVEKNDTPKHFRLQSSDMIQSYEHSWKSTEKEITVNITGKGLGFYSLSQEYTMGVRNVSKQFRLDVKSNYTNYTLILKVCTRYEATVSHNRSNMALVEVNFPSGFVVDKRSIKNLSEKLNQIQNYELRYGQTALVVYYSSMGSEENCFEVHAHRRFSVNFHHPSYVLVYDIIDPQTKAMQSYEAPGIDMS